MRLSRLLPAGLLGSPAFSAVGKRVFSRSDRVVLRLTRGRASFSGLSGQPLIMLETTGRRSGEPRVTPLTYAMQGADFLVAGSNWGQEHQPAWALNLHAHPAASVDLHGKRFPVTAQLLAGEEREQAWRLLLQIWPAYDKYADRVSASSGREIMVFRLKRASDVN